MAKPKNLPATDLSALDGIAEQFPSTQPEKATKVKSKSAEPDSPLTVKIPAYVHKDLRVKAATTGKTQREILLESLKQWGITVHEDDISDRRKA